MLKKRFLLPLLATLLLLFSSCTSFPADSSSGRTTEDILSGSGYDTDYEHSCYQMIVPCTGIIVNIPRGDYAWYHFVNSDVGQSFGIYVVNPDPVCIEPYPEQIIGFSPDSRKEVALTGTVMLCGEKQYYTFYDFYLPKGGDIYFRISSRSLHHLFGAFTLLKLEFIQEVATDDYGNHFLQDLHVHELTFYTCDLDSRDYDPSLGHYHTCWKGDLSVFEEHVFGEPYEGEDGKTYSSCLYCDYRKEMDSSSSTNV